jgi:hypothetical protein
MRLTVAGCSRLWKSAQQRRPEPWEGRWHCRRCPIGAANAGAQVEPVALGGEDWRLVCSRCLRQADRLIRNRHCVSCYNREREVKVGRNSKGSTPRLTGHFHPVTAAVGRAGVVELVTMPNVLGMPEVLVQTARTATACLAFGAPGRAWGVPAAETSAPPEAPQPPGDAPRGEGDDARRYGEGRQPRRPTFRDHLLASSRHTWPALAHSRAGSVAP